MEQQSEPDDELVGTDARRGAAYTYSALAIQTALMLRLLYPLPVRQTEGFLRSILALMGVD